MKYRLLLLFVLVFCHHLFGQKKVEIAESDVVRHFIEELPKRLNSFDLKDLRSSTDSLNIRIWQPHRIFTLNFADSISSNYKIHAAGEKPISSTYNFSENISKNILDSLSAYRIMELQDENYRGLDGAFVFFEIATKNEYKVVSFWSPSAEKSNDSNSVFHILSMLNRSIGALELQNEFRNSLPPGEYVWGMKSLHMDRFLAEGAFRTDFYDQVEMKIKTELNITEETNHWEYPIVLIDDNPAMIADLNNYTQSEVSKLEILGPDNEELVLYGSRGSKGIVKLETR